MVYQFLQKYKVRESRLFDWPLRKGTAHNFIEGQLKT